MKLFILFLFVITFTTLLAACSENPGSSVAPAPPMLPNALNGRWLVVFPFGTSSVDISATGDFITFDTLQLKPDYHYPEFSGTYFSTTYYPETDYHDSLYIKLDAAFIDSDEWEGLWIRKITGDSAAFHVKGIRL